MSYQEDIAACDALDQECRKTCIRYRQSKPQRERESFHLHLNGGGLLCRYRLHVDHHPDIDTDPWQAVDADLSKHQTQDSNS